VTFATEVYDKGSNFASSVFTASKRARHSFTFGLTHDNRGVEGDQWVATAVQNGTRPIFEWPYTMPANFGSLGGHFDIELAPGDTVEIRLRRASGRGSFVVPNQPLANFFSGKADH
jgi:hypothetical protein